MDADAKPPRGQRRLLWVLGGAQALLWLGFALLSREFAYGSVSEERPFAVAGALVATTFALYLFAAFRFGRGGAGVRAGDVLLVAVLLRVPLLLFSHPVQEIDFYRYLWDGRVVREGVSPHRLSPADWDRLRATLSADAEGPEAPDVSEAGVARGVANASDTIPTEREARLLRLLDESPPLAAILERIDHREVPSVYPAVSQAVFAAAATPPSWPWFAQMAALRGVLALFDLGTVALLLLLARRHRAPAGLAIVYAWCPLVVKEFANTAHMDSIPVFFTVAAFWAATRFAGTAANGVKGMARIDSQPGPKSETRGFTGQAAPSVPWLALSWALLMLAVFAKWYPLVLAPLFAAYALRRAGWRGIAAAAPACLLAAALLWGSGSFGGGTERVSATDPDPGAGGAGVGFAGREDLEGLRAFLQRWEMNDLLFSVVRENLRLRSDAGEAVSPPEPWYSVLPAQPRETWAVALRQAGLPEGGPTPDFLGAQLACGGVLALLVAALGWRLLRATDPPDAAGLGRALFLALAASWYLSATQNPWYWIWALPFAAFARSRLWLLVAAAAMLYYGRFWLIYQFPDPFWRGCDGRRLFDEVAVWFEHLPILLAAIAAELGRLPQFLSRPRQELWKRREQGSDVSRD